MAMGPIKLMHTIIDRDTHTVKFITTVYDTEGTKGTKGHVECIALSLAS